MPESKTDPVNVSLKEAARIIGCGLTTMRNRIAAGDVKARKLGRKLVVDYRSATKFASSLPPAKLYRRAKAR